MIVDVTIHHTAPVTTRLPIVPYRLGIIKQDLTTEMERSIDVQARKMNDSPVIGAKGDTMVVGDEWYIYMKKLMTDAAWTWWGVAPRMLMINRVSKWYDETSREEPRFECIALPCNFVASDQFINGFARVVARDSRNFPALSLDPAVDNWFHRPWQFWKCTAHNPAGDVFLVGTSLHVYSPVIREEEAVYIQSDFVEWFPELPRVVTYDGKAYTITDYAVQGASVYGHAAEMDIPLRLARTAGELIHPCPDWRLYERPVPPDPQWYNSE